MLCFIYPPLAIMTPRIYDLERKTRLQSLFDQIFHGVFKKNRVYTYYICDLLHVSFFRLWNAELANNTCNCDIFWCGGTFFLARRIYTFKSINYEIINSQISITKGGGSNSKKTIDRNNIHFIETKSYISDKIFGTSTIRLYTGEVIDQNDQIKKKFDELESIKDANKVVELLKSKSNR